MISSINNHQISAHTSQSSETKEKKTPLSPQIPLSDNPLSPGFSVFSFYNPPPLTEEEKAAEAEYAYRTKIKEEQLARQAAKIAAHQARMEKCYKIKPTRYEDIPTLHLNQPYYIKKQ